MAKGHEESLVTEMFCVLIVVVFSQVYRADLTHCIMYFKKDALE